MLVKYVFSQLTTISMLNLTLTSFKFARYFDPCKVTELKPTSSDVDKLKNFPFLRPSSIIEPLKIELPLYISKAEDVSTEVLKTEWWKGNYLHGLQLVRQFY